MNSDLNKASFGFWVYLMTDCVLFASLFATYVVLHDGTFGGPSSAELFDLPFALTETLILLTSTFTCGLTVLAMHQKSRNFTLFWLGITLVLGAVFLGLELTEFRQFINEGNSWQRSGFLSAFFTLVGTHGLHIAAGLLWALFLVMTLLKSGITERTIKRVTLFSLFWHFLDIIWIFIFTIVYMLGVIN